MLKPNQNLCIVQKVTNRGCSFDQSVFFLVNDDYCRTIITLIGLVEILIIAIMFITQTLIYFWLTFIYNNLYA